MIEAKVIADSVCQANDSRVLTFELQYPRFIHGEVMTHRVFSRNAMSSRAIPVAKMIDQVRENPAMPVWWGKNQPGMQAKEELSPENIEIAKNLWMDAAINATRWAASMNELGLHKQITNRVLEPFQWMRTLVTATEWDNFYDLRDHPDAQPEFMVLAQCMRKAMNGSIPVTRHLHNHTEGFFDDHAAWHLPYISDEERLMFSVEDLCKISTARCARVSYLTHGGDVPRYNDDIVLFGRLVGSLPIHASPTEHQAMANHYVDMPSNLKGWVQYRKILEKN